jgi:hypothetical protein
MELVVAAETETGQLGTDGQGPPTGKPHRTHPLAVLLPYLHP